MSTEYTITKEIESIGLRRDQAGVDLVIFDSLTKLESKAWFLAGEIRRQASKMKASVARIAIHALDPGGRVEPHIDRLDGKYTRMHLPVTAPVHWWDEDNGDMVLEKGRWSVAVPYNRLHSVHNPTDVRRITVIVDFIETTS